MNKLFNVAAALAAAFILSGCSTIQVPGAFNGLGNDVMSMMIIYRTDDQPLTREQYDTVSEIAQKMGVKIGWQLSSPVESALSQAVVYGAAGAAGGATQGLFYPAPVMVGAAAGYSGSVYALAGAVNGLVTASYANVYAIAHSTEVALRDEERYSGRKDLRRIHVVGAFIRSRNSLDSPAPGLQKQMRWSGSRVGE